MQRGAWVRAMALLAAVAVVACATDPDATTDPGASTPATSARDATPFDTESAFVDGDPVTVRTPAGIVRGATDGAVRRFQAIPYAAPPVGDLRWKAPQPVPRWDGVREAVEPPAVCTQVLPVVDLPIGQEDCLYLDVVTPEAPSDSLKPVMVWIHGGGFTIGSANDVDTARITERGDVVTVSINYRLGPFGYLAHPLLEAEDPDRALGTMGFLDQVAALQWVQDSIASFGGDPGDVTVFGESAGGMSVCGHLFSPRSVGLFDRAILQSGPCVTGGLPEVATVPQSATISEVLGCTGVADELACLRAVDAETVQRALPGDPTFFFQSGALWMPTADEVVLPYDIETLAAAGNFEQVPVLAGVTSHEGRFFLGMAAHTPGATLERVTTETYAARARAYFGDEVGNRVVDQYPAADYPGPSEAFAQAVGDAVITCPALDGARALARHVPVHLYEYAHTPNEFILPMDGIDLGAFHTSELPYVFGRAVQTSGPIELTDDERALSDTMIDAWVAFARTGDPSTPALRWPDAGDDQTYVVLDTPTDAGTGLFEDACAFWETTGWTVALAGRQ